MSKKYKTSKMTADENHHSRLQHVLDTINYLNEWRREAIKHVIDKEGREKIDAEVLYRRNAVES